MIGRYAAGGYAPTRLGRLPFLVQGPNDLRIDLPLRAVRRGLLALVLGLAAASVLAQIVKYELDPRWPGAANLFDANQEANFPTLYSTLAFAVAALLLVAIGASGQGAETRSHWFALGGLFAFAAIDEAADLHDLLNDPLRSLLDTTGALSYPWVLPGSLLLAVVVVLFRRFVGRLPRPVRRLAAVGAALLAGGALGVESVENLLADSAGGDPTLSSALMGTLSEFCEMLGVALIIEALLLYIALERGSLSLTLRPTARSGADRLNVSSQSGSRRPGVW